MEAVKIQKMTMKLVKAIKPGHSGTFAMPTARALVNAKATAYWTSKIEELPLSVNLNYATNEITISVKPSTDK